jgi:hypothetical protein
MSFTNLEFLLLSRPSASDKMKRLIKTPYALCNEQLIHISSARRNADYFCPACLVKMVPKMGPKNRHHFSHNENTNCSQESVLHKTAKYLLEANIKEPAKPTVGWDCPTCRKPHSSDLFATTTELCVEQHLGTCKPDITARAENGDIKAFVEVVVQHDPEPYVYEAGNALCIPVIEFKLKKMEDLATSRESAESLKS